MKERTMTTREYLKTRRWNPCQNCENCNEIWNTEDCKNCKTTVKVSNYERMQEDAEAN